MFEREDGLPAAQIVHLQLLLLDVDHTLVVVLTLQVVLLVLFAQVRLDVYQTQLTLVVLLRIHRPERI